MQICQMRYNNIYYVTGMQALDKDLYNVIFMDAETEAPHWLSYCAYYCAASATPWLGRNTNLPMEKLLS